MALVILFFVLAFATIFGGYVGSDPYDDLAFLKSIIDYIILVFSMMVIPFIYKIVKADNYDEDKGKKICAWNMWIVLLTYFCLDAIAMRGIYDETIQNLGENIVYALMFYYINKKIFCHRSEEKLEKDPNRLYECKSCGYRNQEFYDACPQCGNHTKQYAYINDEKKQEISPNVSEIEISTNEPTSQGKRKYCSQCGGLINNKTKVCEGCGKQYFKVFSSKIIVMIIIAILLVVSIVISLILHIQNTKLNDRIEELEIENQQYYNYWVESFEQIAFFDEFVVFVEDDGTNWYHKYECRRFTGNDFWAFNIDAAIIDGYKPCPFCCE